MLVQAGAAADAVIDELVPLLDDGDIVVDCGNAHLADTRRREAALAEHGLHFVGCGMSGGQDGALNGPSIATEVESEPCVVHVDPDGAATA